MVSAINKICGYAYIQIDTSTSMNIYIFIDTKYMNHTHKVFCQTQDQTPFGKADGMPAVQRAKILILIEEIGSSITFKIKKNCKNILEQEYTIDLKKLSEYEKWINMKQRITPPPDVPEGKTFIEINCCR
eukprot:GHVL01020782.1.p1 GENE.GHVL01020782.1~~GHVL01020782.1.p1  ORF type:complete len:130 (+),score=26.53 GHVL01020782.1:327-716(+)